MVSLAMLCGTVHLTVTAQTLPSGDDGLRFRIGLLGGGSYNYVAADARDFITVAGDPRFSSLDFSKSDGFAPFGGLYMEFPPNRLLSAYLRATYDDRSIAAKVSGAELDVNLAYITIDPGLRINLFGSTLHMLLGGSAQFNIIDRFSYHPDGGEGSITVDDADLINVNKTTLGVWGGFGYDIRLNPDSRGIGWLVTPFIEGSYLFDQFSRPLDDGSEQWNTLTGRAGIAVAMEFGPEPVVLSEIAPPPAITFSVTPPRFGVIEPGEVSEQFPLLNYLFFDSGSSDIPGRYPRLSMTQAKGFDEDALDEEIGPGSLRALDRAARQMNLYYNTINIIGSRMMNKPSSKITLIGSAPDVNDARQMAEKVKYYLVSTFGIADDRITTKGQIRPPHASGTRATPKEDLPLVAVENRRVEILSNDGDLLKPVELRTTIEAPFSNDLLVRINSSIAVKSWTMRITGNGFRQWYGPFYTSSQRINTTQMLTGAPEGTFTAMLVAVTDKGKSVISEQEFSLRRQEALTDRGNRFSILFEFDESKTVAMYEDFLRNQVAPLIPEGATIYVHGYTDVIGETEYNAELSEQRAKGALDIILDELGRLGRAPLFFEAYGFGEEAHRASFTNDTPEGRYHNRTVIIDVVQEY
jgi:outer membrane protein OmpA-like peptidoglycan-associated protein